MLEYGLTRDAQTGEDVVVVPFTGAPLLDNPLFNKGSAFSEAERKNFGLLGLLPPHVNTLDNQLARRYGDYLQKSNDLERHIYLRDLQDRNEVLYYRLLLDHIAELTPMIYTPVVGAACQHFSLIYRRPRGLFLSHPYRTHFDEMLDHRPWRDVDVIVVTDGERILGLGDQGVGGMGIPVGKLALYTLCGGIHPARTLPILLDVGTDNADLFRDPLYLGWRHHRIRGAAYDDFVEAFIQALERKLPNVLLQWEDFAQPNAQRLLERYRGRLCCFNDDIQGTAAVTLAGLLAAAGVTASRLRDQRIVMVGAGSAGIGIGDVIVHAMTADGLTEVEARSRLWFIDRVGLLRQTMAGLTAGQMRYAQPAARVDGWQRAGDGTIALAEVIKRVRPTVLCGVSGQPGLFNREIVVEMAAHVERPIIFALSNPTSRSEAIPVDLIAWTEGRAVVATGSPFADVPYLGQIVPVSQCNNVYIFPGVGLGVIASGARRVTDAMFLQAAHALADCSPARRDPQDRLFPPLQDIRAVSKNIAQAVGEAAQREGVAERTTREELIRRIDARMWMPHYPLIRRTIH
jgi:malate dehydrogenase (oxaloacetate-decarboxylating)